MMTMTTRVMKKSFRVFRATKNANLCGVTPPFFFFEFADLNRENSQEIDEGDIQALDALHSSNAGERKTLADIIFSKLESSTGQTAVIRASNRCMSIWLDPCIISHPWRHPTDAHMEC
jgi:hypothetical protein